MAWQASNDARGVMEIKAQHVNKEKIR